MSVFKNLFGGGEKKSTPPPPEPPPSTNVNNDSEEERKKKRIGRASLYGPLGVSGDLSTVQTASGKVLGN